MGLTLPEARPLERQASLPGVTNVAASNPPPARTTAPASDRRGGFYTLPCPGAACRHAREGGCKTRPYDPFPPCPLERQASLPGVTGIPARTAHPTRIVPDGRLGSLPLQSRMAPLERQASLPGVA